MWPFRRGRKKLGARKLFARWFRVQVPEGHPSLEAYEAAISEQEKERLPKTIEKLAMDGVERIYQVRRVELEPDRTALEYLDGLLDAEMRWKLTADQDPLHPRNLFRLVATEFGCIVGEIWVRAGKAQWRPQRPPNLWRSRLVRPDGKELDPFFCVVKQMSDDHEPDLLARTFDSVPCQDPLDRFSGPDSP